MPFLPVPPGVGWRDGFLRRDPKCLQADSSFSRPTDPLLTYREHLLVFDPLLERKNMSYFPDTALCHAAPGHQIFVRVVAAVTGDSQLWGSTASSQCGLRFLSLELKEVDTLVPVLSLYELTLAPSRPTKATCDAYFEICVSVSTPCVSDIYHLRLRPKLLF